MALSLLALQEFWEIAWQLALQPARVTAFVTHGPATLRPVTFLNAKRRRRVTPVDGFSGHGRSNFSNLATTSLSVGTLAHFRAASLRFVLKTVPFFSSTLTQ